MPQASSCRWAGALLILVLAAPARAITPDPLPDAVWWRVHDNPALALDPLETLLEPPGLAVSSEWAPLYRSPDGARLEQMRHAAALRGASGSWRWAAELEEGANTTRGGNGAWWVAARRPDALWGLVGLGHRTRRLDLAGAGGAREAGLAGASLTARALLAPGWHGEWNWSRWPLRRRLEVRWDDTRALASGLSFDQRARWRVEGSFGRLATCLELAAVDERPGATGPRDGLEPVLAWRSAELRIEGSSKRNRWAAEVAHGEGREGVRVLRGGGRLAHAAGPIANTQLALEARGAGSPWSARAWTGVWRGDARAALALGPFDALAGALGTRRVAVSRARLWHLGVALDRKQARPTGWEYGVAAWHLEPRADYRSWQATLIGLGRDDLSSGAAEISAATLLGLRLAGAFPFAGAVVRAEAVQWVPVRVERDRRDGGGDAGMATGRDRGTTWGGTVLRLTIGPGQ